MCFASADEHGFLLHKFERERSWTSSYGGVVVEIRMGTDMRGYI